jgi:lantibiotic biosynthesis protein
LQRQCSHSQFDKRHCRNRKTAHLDKILAEIVHIPESRTGNILRRPVLRNYEIAYLCNPGTHAKNTLPLTDLMVFVENNKVVLWSKFHNKEVLPCLSNAHNYSNNALPIYHFLCDLQAQHLKPIYGFEWGVVANHYDFLPRVTHKNVILCKAKWMVSKNELAVFNKKTAHELFNAFSVWRKQREIDQFVNFVHYDNTLLLDFEATICIEMFLKLAVNHTKIILEEFLFQDSHVVKNEDQEGFTNQFIVSFSTTK